MTEEQRGTSDGRGENTSLHVSGSGNPTYATSGSGNPTYTL
jgi:hypothetical protein